MKTQSFYWLILAILILNKGLHARPISYQGGWTIMQMNDFKTNSIHLHLSPSVNYSIGYRGEYWRIKKWKSHSVQLNYLIKRINRPKSQANFYFKNGLGFASSSNNNYKSKIEPNLFSGILFDWEDRRNLISYENKFNHNFTIDKYFLQKIRFGLAPYLGKYGDLHSWIIIQIEHMPRAENKIIYTPLLRIFKGDFLSEVGLNNHKELMFNFIKRF